MTKEEIKKSNDSIAQHIGRHKGKYMLGLGAGYLALKAPLLSRAYDKFKDRQVGYFEPDNDPNYRSKQDREEETYRHHFSARDMTPDEANKRMSALKNNKEFSSYNYAKETLGKDNSQEDLYRKILKGHSMTDDEVNKRMTAIKSHYKGDQEGLDKFLVDRYVRNRNNVN